MFRQATFGATILLMMLSLPLTETWGRGFGGRGGGGRGGFSGGGFSGGGRGGFGGGGHSFGGSPGGFNGGASHSFGGSRGGSAGGASRSPGGFGASGFHSSASRGPGGSSVGGRGGSSFGGSNRGGIGGGRLGGSGFGGASSSGLGSGRPDGTGLGGIGAAGPGGGRPGGGLGGQRSSGQAANRFAKPSTSQLNSFLGLPGRGATAPGSLGVGAGNIGIGGDAGIGGGRAGMGAGGVGGPASGIGALPGAGAGGVGGPASGIGRRPGVGAGRAGAGIQGVGGYRPFTASARYTTAAEVRRGYDHWGLYGRDWYARYPGAWIAGGWAAGAAWRACAWTDAASYCGYTEAAPVYYDYGNNVTYENDSVYINNQPVGSGEQYYDQAANLASTGASAAAPTSDDWLPLGVFALTKPDAAKSSVTIQLAVNKQGIIRGNATDTTTDKNQVIQGSVDKKTQRVAFTVGDNKTEVVETGLYNLTKDEAPCLIHFDKDKSEQWLLVRLKANQDTATQPKPSSSRD